VHLAIFMQMYSWRADVFFRAAYGVKRTLYVCRATPLHAWQWVVAFWKHNKRGVAGSEKESGRNIDVASRAG
jgi:hypothetical protein